MNKRILSIVCLVLIACITFTLVACNNGDDKPDDTKPNDTACTEHVDANTDGKCDNCNADMPNTPNEPDEPDEPEVPVVDPTKDVANAVALLNKMLSGNTEQAPEVEVVKLLMTLSNATITGNLVDTDGVTFPVKSVAIDGDLIKAVAEIEGQEVEAYFVYNENGMCCVTTDGETYDYSFEPIDMAEMDSAEETKLPELTEEDIVYDAATGYFVVQDSYMQKVMDAMMPEDETTSDTNNEDVGSNINDMIGIPGLQETIEAMKYEVKFKVTAENTISELNVKGVVMQNEIRNELLAIVLKNDDTGCSFTATVNYMVNISLNVKYEVETENTGKFTASFVMIPPMGVEMERQDFNFSVDVELADSEIVVSDELKTHLDKAKEILNKLPEIQEKYSDTYSAEDVECAYVAVYDETYGVYVVFANDWEGYVYDSVCVNVDTEEVCIGTITDKTMTVTEHCDVEKAEAEAASKYEGTFTSEDGCETILVWDEAVGQFAVFEMDFFEDGVYEFSYLIDEPWGVCCFGTVDLANKTLTVVEHDELEAFVAYVHDRNFVAEGVTSDCSDIYVVHEATNYYVFFMRNSDNTWSYCGYSNWSPDGCRATINVNTNTLTIVEHSH